MFITVYYSIGLTTVCLISLCRCSSLYQTVYSHTHQSDMAGNFSEAIAAIVRSHFVGKHKRITYNFQVNVKCYRNMQFFQNIMDETVKMLSEDIAVILRSQGPIAETDDMHFSILLVDSLEAVEFLYFNLIKYDLYIYGAFFIVLHSLCPTWHYYNEMSDILTLSWSAGISHVDILIYAGANVILLYHGIPFSVFHCHYNLPEIHNKFIDGHWQHKRFYVSKASNIHGCPLICSSWEDMPYFKVSSRSTPEKPSYMGLEGRLLEYLQQRMNFKMIIRWMTTEQINRTTYDRHNLLKELFHNGTDFTLGSYHYKTTKREDPYSPTISYYPSTYYFVVSSKTDPYEPFEKLLLPFGLDVWAILILLCIGGNIIIYFFSHMSRQWQALILGRRNHSPYYNLLVVLFGGPVVQDPKVSFSRFLLMVWLFNMSVVRNVYQSLMFHVLKNDLHKPPPKAISDLKNGYTILMSETVYSRLTNFPWLREHSEFLNKSELESFDMLKDPSIYAPRKYSILTAYEYFGFYAYSRVGLRNFHLIPQVLFTQRLSFFMKKNSVFLNRFNIYIDTFINEGLMNRWERVLIYSDRFYRRHREDEARPMSIRELYGAINLLVIGLGVCILVFVGELTFKGAKKLYRYRAKLWRKRRVSDARFEYVD